MYQELHEMLRMIWREKKKMTHPQGGRHLEGKIDASNFKSRLPEMNSIMDGKTPREHRGSSN